MKLAKKDIRHLDWIYERMKSTHNEPENYDYMIAFRRIIDGLYKEYADYHKPQSDLPAENTVMWWLCRISDDEVRRKAVGNCLEQHESGHMNTMSVLESTVRESVWMAFTWAITEEEEPFWSEVYNSEIPLLPEPDFTEYLELRKWAD